MLRQVRRFSYAPPKGSGSSDNSSFFSLLGIAGVIGYVRPTHAVKALLAVCTRADGVCVCVAILRTVEPRMCTTTRTCSQRA